VFKPWAGAGKREPTLREDAALAHWFSERRDEGACRHRPATEEDVELVTRVGGTRLTIEELEDMGVRVQKNMISEMQEQLLQMEVAELIDQFGFSFAGDNTVLHSVDAQGKILDSKNHVNATRVTGRPEGVAPVAPWGYGSNFDIEKVPSSLRFLVDYIADSPHFAVGKPRDITLNRRENSFFKLDPHTDPVADGENIFIISLLSNSVMTIVPPGDFTRKRPGEISLKSWTDQDIDILLRRRSMLLLSGRSRMPWKHAMRTGVQVEFETEGKKDLAVCDWWGKTQNLVRRSPQRVSIIIAFGKPAETPGEDSSLFD